MRHFTDISAAQSFCECLASPARVEILKLVLEKKADSLDSLAKTLHMTNGAITQHVKKLVDAGLVKLVEFPGKHGTAKKCVVTVDRVIIDIAADAVSETERNFELPIGSFTAAAVKPYCAIASSDGFIGERDDPRYFTFPERINATFLYFNSGNITYTLPAPAKKPLKSITVSMEISSKPYGHGRSRDSVVSFAFGETKIGEHRIDGEFTDRRGLFTPSIFSDMPQYGKYKTLTVDEKGSFLDGIKLGSTSISDIRTDNPSLTLSTDGGIALFGKGYGDYNCGLRVKMYYRD
ncbi:MAG: helix-turn-helix domain-containing protein [Clostridiales bacterium]|nr:helix-turn-helix domain-containing protein [Clostridiales bacterium]